MKIRPKLNQKALIIILLTLGFLFLLGAAYFTPYVQNNRYVKARKIEKLAEKYPPGSNEYSRLKAIAEALRRGKKNYTYTPNSLPMNLGSQL